MTRKSNHIQSNSRARDKSNKRVRANNSFSRSTIRPNTTFRSVVSKSRSTSSYSSLTSVRSKTAKASTKSKCSQKASRRSQSDEVVKNVPIIESTFYTFSAETASRPSPCCHIEEMTEEQKAFYIDQCFSPCDAVKECSECIFFHI